MIRNVIDLRTGASHPKRDIAGRFITRKRAADIVRVLNGIRERQIRAAMANRRWLHEFERHPALKPLRWDTSNPLVGPKRIY